MGHVRVCEILLAAVKDKNLKDDGNETPLSLAEKNGHTDVCEKIRKFIFSGSKMRQLLEDTGCTRLYLD